MRIVQTQAPAAEPLSLDDAKTHLRVDDDLTEDDALISLMITACRKEAEKRTARSFITQKWQLVMDCFPGGIYQSYATIGEPHSNPPSAVRFERGPVQSVDSIVYVDMSGATQTITSPGMPDYAIDLSGPVGRMTPAFGKIWPIPLPQIGAVKINYTAGYGTTADMVPETVRLWMLAAIQTVYRNRGVLIQLQRGERVDAFDFINGFLDDLAVVEA